MHCHAFISTSYFFLGVTASANDFVADVTSAGSAALGLVVSSSPARPVPPVSSSSDTHVPPEPEPFPLQYTHGPVRLLQSASDEHT